MCNFIKAIYIISAMGLLTACAVKTNAQCNAAFTYYVNAPSVSFVATDTTPGKGHLWFFGDGQSVWYQYSTTHTYYAPGQYTVKHVIIDSLNNCADSSMQIITVNFAATCQAAFNSFPWEDSMISSHYYFSDASSVTGGRAAIKSYLWAVNGALIDSSQPALFYTFPSPGSYNVCLNIKTYAGCSSQACSPITVYGMCKLGPSFTYTVDSSYPANVTFYAQPIIPGFEYAWRVGGYFVPGQQYTSPYYQPGNYSATVFMIDTANRCFDSTAGTFTVNGVACDTVHASFTYQADPNNASIVYFTAHSNDVMVNQTWQIQSVYDSSLNITLNNNNPAYQFTDTGYYQVCLNATTKHCGVLTTCNVVQIAGSQADPRLVHAYPNPATNSVGIDVPLEANATININIYNENGTRVLTMQTQGVPGTNHFNIPVNRLTNGQYFVDITAGADKRHGVFQKN